MSTKRISEKEAADHIGISRTHLANLRKNNKGPSYFQLGKRVLYTSEDVETWLLLNKQTCGGSQDPTPSATTTVVDAVAPF